MKVINMANIYEIRDNTLKTFDELPAQTYVVRFSKMRGFYLELYTDIEIKEEKIYGVHLSKIDKVLRVFHNQNRNLGIILSGNKGIGKSLFAKILGVSSIEQGLPLIIVDEYIPGIASFIEKIEQEVVVLFDEFDKTFGDQSGRDNEISPQASLLSLFDGISQGKKMFVITCNNIRKLNDYLINRPGRFHYHFRFEYPSPVEVREYLEDKLVKEYYPEINKVVSFSRKVDLNYDCLRSIVFELNMGEPFEKAILDLNIVNVEKDKFDVEMHFEGNVVHKNKDIYMDIFGTEEESTWLCDQNGNYAIRVDFCPADSNYDADSRASIITADKLKFTYDESESENPKNLVPKFLVIKKRRDKNIHYVV